MVNSQKKKPKKVNLAVKVSKTKRKNKVVKSKNTVSLAEKNKAENKKESQNTVLKPRILSEKIESDKRLIMWSGVTFFMLLIGFLWIFQIKQSIKKVELESNSDDSMIELRTAAESIGEAIAQMKNDISAVNDFSDVEKESKNSEEPNEAEELDKTEMSAPAEESVNVTEFASSTEEIKATSSLSFPKAEDVGTSSAGVIN